MSVYSIDGKLKNGAPMWRLRVEQQDEAFVWRKVDRVQSVDTWLGVAVQFTGKADRVADEPERVELRGIFRVVDEKTGEVNPEPE